MGAQAERHRREIDPQGLECLYAGGAQRTPVDAPRQKIKKHEEKVRLETDLEYLNNDLECSYQESQNNLSLTLNKDILEKEKIDVNSLPAKNILQNELSNEKRKFEKIGPINFRAETEAYEANKKIEKMMNEGFRATGIAFHQTKTVVQAVVNEVGLTREELSEYGGVIQDSTYFDRAPN